MGSTMPLEVHPVTESGTGAEALADGPGAGPPLTTSGSAMVRPPHSSWPKAPAPVQYPSTPGRLVQVGVDNKLRAPSELQGSPTRVAPPRICYRY